MFPKLYRGILSLLLSIRMPGVSPVGKGHARAVGGD